MFKMLTVLWTVSINVGPLPPQDWFYPSDYTHSTSRWLGGSSFLISASLVTQLSDNTVIVLPQGATLRVDILPITEMTGDAFVNGDDYDLFVSYFEQGDPRADINLDSFVTGDDYDLYTLVFTR